MRKIRYLVIHHSASPRDTTDVAMIRRWHIEERGWTDIGYHWVIQGDGVLYTGRSIYLMGAHVRGFNKESLGVCVTGNNTTPLQRWNKVQIRTLKQLVASCAMIFPGLEIVGHRDLTGGTACPGLDVKELLL